MDITIGHGVNKIYNNIINKEQWKEQQINSKQITSGNQILYEDIAQIICEYT